MIKRISTVFFVLILCFSPAHAGPFTDNLSRCLVVSADESDRSALIYWVFRIIAEHPDIKNEIGNVFSEIQKTRSDLDVAEIFTKLVVDKCPSETREAWQYEQELALQAAFEVLGKVAMQELMTHPVVNAEAEKFAEYLDEGKLSRVME